MKESNTKSIMLCSLFTALIAVGAFIKIPVPNIPITLQFMFTTLAGLLLGSRLGVISVLVYLIIGLIGIPIFTNGGGIGYIFQPTFGYLIGFCGGTFVSGKIIENLSNISFKTLLLACFANLIIVYSLGTIYFYLISNYYLNSPIGVKALLLNCFILVIPGDLISCFASAFIAQRVIPILKKQALL